MLLPLLMLAALGDWPGWRGPTGMGQSDARGLPLTWAAKPAKNLLWVHPLDFGGKAKHDQNQSSPIVISGLVIISHSYWPEGVSNKEFPRHVVRAIGLDDGKQRWETIVVPGPWSRASDLRGGYTAPTPAADKERVYVCFGSSVLAAIDLKGKLVWRKEVRPTDYDVAMASSPVLVDDAVVMQLDGARNSRLTAFDTKTGEVKWNEKRPKNGFCHSTPVLTKVGGKRQLLVAANNQVQGVDPTSGKVLWYAKASGDTASPVLGDGLVYLDNGRGSGGTCVDPTGSGDVSKTHTKWSQPRVSGGFSSPVVVDGLLYRLIGGEQLKVWKMKTGDEVATIRLAGVNAAVSPIATADGRIYLASAGRSYVIKAGEKPEVIGKSDLGDASNASPAVSGGKLILRGRQNVWCIGAKPDK